MGSAGEGAVQMCGNKTSPDPPVRCTDFIYFHRSAVSSEGDFVFQLLLSLGGVLNSGCSPTCRCESQQAARRCDLETRAGVL